MRCWALTLIAFGGLITVVCCESGGLWPFRPLPCKGGAGDLGVPKDMAVTQMIIPDLVPPADMGAHDMTQPWDMVPRPDMASTIRDMTSTSDMPKADIGM